ncbi:helix-turn-helix transcriptional regulator [Thaumasiovibrio sp. DFM-14]|uniref:AraC family transcriptional regulator n=1 Tax=Thaumasiovibrio sp. DFM-14 TaxID=3384792 RepID=UPI0039A36493
MSQKIHISEKTTQYMVNSLQLPELIDGGLFECGFATARELFSICRSLPDKYMIIYSVQGEGCIETNDDSTDLSENMVAYLPRYSPHSINLTGHKWDIAWLATKDNELILDLPQTAEFRNCSNGILLNNTIRNLQIIRSHEALDSQLLKLHIKQMRLILENSLPSQRDKAEVRLAHLFQKVERQLHKGWTVAGLAELFPCSETQLFRLCDQYLGHGPKTELTKIRMEHASQMLKGTDVPIQIICETVGYPNAANFSTCFKKWYSLSPSTYRKKGRG